MTKKRTSGHGQRNLRVRVKTARGRSLSSTRWLARQLNDVYVRQARREGYRGRAAYKLLELDNKYHFLRRGSRVIDLGCAPGGWLQVAAKRVGAKGLVLGIDLRKTEPIADAQSYILDFLATDSDIRIQNLLSGCADVVLSDMAAASCGHKQTDHLRVVALSEAAADFAFTVLAPKGVFVVKVLAGGAEAGLQKTLKQKFTRVLNVKPQASRSDSSEKYVVALGFRP